MTLTIGMKKDGLGRIHIAVRDRETGACMMDIRIYNVHRQWQLVNKVKEFIEAQNK